MWSSIISLVAFAMLAVLIVVLFAKDVVIVIANAAMLYFIWLAIYADVTKRRMLKDYLYGLVAGVLLAWIAAKYVPLWFITLAAAFTLIIVKAAKKLMKKS